MSFRVDIQSAPQRQGTIDDPSSWSGASGTTVTSSGTYDGTKNKTYTFTVVDAGTIDTTATISLDWDDGDGNTGRLNLGDDRYDAGDDVEVAEGIALQFTASDLAASDTFTLDVTAGNVIPGTPVVVTGDASPTDVQIQDYTRGDRDIVTHSFDGREDRVQRSTTGTVRLLTDYLDDTNRDKILYLHSSRTPVCVGENFNEDTIFLLHGGGLSPFIGVRSDFTRATQATYPDPRTGLLRSVASGDVRVVSGKAGRALLLEAASTNLFDYSAHETPSTIWNTSGSGMTLSYDTTVKGPYDPTDTYWNDAHLNGVAKLYSDSSVDGTTDYIHTDDVTVSGATNYTASVWLRGRGSINVSLRAGTGSISTTLEAETGFQLTDDWQRLALTGATSGGHNVADLRITPQEAGICYFTGWQIEAAELASGLIQTAGSSATRNLDDQTFSLPIPPTEGTISMWFYWPETQLNSATYSLLSVTNSGTDYRDFAIEIVDGGSPAVWFYTGASGIGIVELGANLTRDTWHHFVFTWQEHTDDDEIIKGMWINGVEQSWFIGSDETSAWVEDTGTGFTLAKAATGSKKSTNGFRIEELRIDKAAMTDAQVADQYARLTDDNWLHVHRAHAGRKYRIASTRDYWLHPSNPDKVIMELVLEEMDREDDSTVIPA